MGFYIDHYFLFLLVSLLVTSLFFRMARRGTMAFAEAWHYLFSLQLAMSALFFILHDIFFIEGNIFSIVYTVVLCVLLLPFLYLLSRMLLGPLFFSFSRKTSEEKLQLLYVKPARVLRYGLLYSAYLGFFTSIVNLVDITYVFSISHLVASIVMLLSSVGLFFVRNTLVAETMDNVALQFMLQGKLKEANELLQSSLTYKADHPKTWMFLVDVHRRLKEYKRAGRYLVRFKRLRPNSPVAGILDAKLHRDVGKHAQAIRICRRYLGSHASNVELLSLACVSSVKLREHSQALDFFERWLVLGGNDIGTLVAAITAYYQTRQYRKVKGIFEAMKIVSKTIPEEAELLYKKATRKLQENK